MFCDTCGKHEPVWVDPMTKDDLNGEKIWGDVCCMKCKLVLITIEVPSEGMWDFTKVCELNEPDRSRSKAQEV